MTQVDWDVRPMHHIKVLALLQIVAYLARSAMIILLDPIEDTLGKPYIDWIGCFREIS